MTRAVTVIVTVIHGNGNDDNTDNRTVMTVPTAIPTTVTVAGAVTVTFMATVTIMVIGNDCNGNAYNDGNNGSNQ